MLPQQIYWIGGSACAGKSTLAGRYADKYNLKLYACDEYYPKHLQRITLERQPMLSAISRLTMNEVFGTRGVKEQLDSYIGCWEEDFLLVLNDLADMGDQSVVVEGNQLLPALVAPLLRKGDRAVWMVPTEDFQLKQYSQREWIQGILQQTDHPEQSFVNWMKRDAMFAAHVKQEALRLKLPLIEVDGSTGVQENFALLEQYFIT